MSEEQKLKGHRPAGLVRVAGDSYNGEELCGMRVAAWRWKQNGHWDFATHWSTGPQETHERLYAEEHVLSLIDQRAALQLMVDKMAAALHGFREQMATDEEARGESALRYRDLLTTLNHLVDPTGLPRLGD